MENYEIHYRAYLDRVNAALEKACGQFLPQESQVCQAAQYSLLGGGQTHPRGTDPECLRYAGWAGSSCRKFCCGC